MNKKANLFVVGAMKAGTTSLNALLAEHPAIYFSPIKEPNFFVKDLPASIYKPSAFFDIEGYLQKKFPDPLHIAHLKNKEQYEKLFSLAGKEHKYLAEGSTAYLHAPESPALIYAYNPEAKVIILLKDGLKRAFSHYKMDLGLGRTKDTFEDNIKQDLHAYRQGKLSNWSYLGMSLYHDNIQRYKRIFDGNVLVISFEDLLKNKEEALGKIFDFLGIETVPLQLNHSNESANIRFQKGVYFLKKTGLKDMLSYVLPVRFRHSVFNSLKKNTPLKMKLPQELRADLVSIFDEDQLRFS